MSDFLMPSLGADMEKGKVVEWRIKPGGTIRKGDIIAVVETHKGAIDVEIFEDGILSEICVKEGEEVPVGAVLARVTHPGAAEAALTPKPPAPAEKPSPVEKPAPVAPPPAPIAIPATARAKVTPAARRRAAERGIDPEKLKGTGIEGSVTLADVEGARAAASPPAPAPETRRKGFDPDEMRKAIAAAMSRSKREIPHYYLTSTIDMGAALSWLAVFNEARPPDQRLLPALLLLKATALALREVPQLNGFWKEEKFEPGSGIHIGWAISMRGGGLIAPALHNVDAMPLPELMTALRDLVARVRSGGLRSSEMMDPTVTVTSLGERGADGVIGVIYPPQVAIIGFGRIAERPWVVDGKVTPRPLVAASLAADHRASDGHAGSLLLSAIDRLLQEPEKL